MSVDDACARTDRHGFLSGLAAGAGALTLGAVPSTKGPNVSTVAPGDLAIVRAALIAEALAVTTYSNIMSTAPFFTRLFPQDQSYLKAARAQELAHYTLLRGVAGAPSAVTSFYYPKGMFAHADVTVNTLVTLEEAFIAAYLVGVRAFASSDLRVAAARIMGVESDHRTMARVLGPGVDPQDGGPLRAIRGLSGVATTVDPANNNAFEGTAGWTRLDQVVAALKPFFDRQAAQQAGFDTSKHYSFS